MARRIPRTPFVITVATAAASAFSPGCGGETGGDGSNQSGGTAGTTATGGTGAGGTGGSSGSGATGGSSGSGASGGTGGTTGGAGGAGGSTGGTSGAGGGPNCPTDLPAWYDPCTDKGSSCSYDVACQSGNVQITLDCSSEGYWTLQPGTCAKPHDSCPGTDLYCNGEYGWTMPQGTNPPSPCPAQPPTAGEQCYSGGFGGVHEKCGYPCDPAAKTGWTVMTCPMAGGQDSMWESDNACNN